MTEIIELRPNKDLMHSSFEKYQFSTDIIPITSEIKLKNHVYRLEPNHDQESWLEARLFAFHNHLFKNTYDLSSWFIDEDWIVWRLDKDGSLNQMYELHTAKINLSKVKYNPSIGFTSNQIIVVSDGGERLDILIRDTRQIIRVLLLNSVEPGVIMNVQHVEKCSKIIITMCTIAADNDQKKYTQLTLLSYALQYVENEIKSISYTDKEIMKVQGTVDYVYIEENGNYLHSICQDTINFENKNIQESENKVEQSSTDSQIKIPKYYWSQNEDSITVWVKIPKQHKTKKPKINVKSLELSVVIDNEILIQGECQHRLEENAATWRHKKDTLQIDLCKYESGLMWSELIKGDTGGECLPNEDLTAEIHARLAHLCTDQQNNSTGEEQPCVGFNAEQLEECDLEGKDNFLQRINLLTKTTTHLTRLGSNNHMLFTYKRKHGQIVCLRHDHDACVWVINDAYDDIQWDIKHVYSFPGFGYVEASKTNKKYCVSPTDGSYVAIVEHTRHVFLYDRPDVGIRTARQRIVDLNCENCPIMGVVATDKYLIVLSKDKLYRLQIYT